MKTPVILLVEDNPDDVALILRALRGNHISNEIVIAKDGVEALDYVCGRGTYEGRDPNDTPALILLDLKLPKLNGFDVLSAVRQNEATRLTPVVILTSSREEADVAKGYQNGANSFVRKPIDFTEFARAIKTLRVYWLLINEPPPAATRD